MSNGSINKVILIGNLGKDPEIRTMQNGKEMASFPIATSESWLDRSSGERVEKTEWHNIVAFNEGLVRVIKEYVRKGTRVYVEGSLRTRKWTDQNNSDRYVTEVILQGFNSAFSILNSRSAAVVDNMSSNNYNSSNSVKDNSVKHGRVKRGVYGGTDLDSRGAAVIDNMKKDSFEEIDDEIPF